MSRTNVDGHHAARGVGCVEIQSDGTVQTSWLKPNGYATFVPCDQDRSRPIVTRVVRLHRRVRPRRTAVGSPYCPLALKFRFTGEHFHRFPIRQGPLVRLDAGPLRPPRAPAADARSRCPMQPAPRTFLIGVLSPLDSSWTSSTSRQWSSSLRLRCGGPSSEASVKA